MSRRAYDNTFRAELAEHTRSRIIDAVRDLLAESKDGPLSIPAVAARAGVSEPTVYRHFPSRDALLEATSARFSDEFGQPPMSDDPDELPALMIAVAHFFGRNDAWMRASLRNPQTAEVRAAGRKRRTARLRATLAPIVAHLEPRERDLVVAMVLAIARLETWDFATRDVGLDADEAGRAAGWALRAMLESLARSKRERRRTLLDDATVEHGRNFVPAETAVPPARATTTTTRSMRPRGRNR